MLLEDFGKDSPKTFKRINKILQEQHGVSLSTKSTLSSLKSTKTQLLNSLNVLKEQGRNSKSCPEISKHLLMLEGINSLIEHRKLEESHQDFSNSRAYQRVIDWMSDFISKNVELGDDIEDVLNQAMKEYRSSKWRFPDEFVRFDAQKQAEAKLAMKNEMYTNESVQENDLNSLLDPDIQLIKDFVADLKNATDSENNCQGDFDHTDGYNQLPSAPDNSLEGLAMSRMNKNKEMQEAGWDDVLDNSGRYKPVPKDDAAIDKYLKGSTLSMQPNDDADDRIAAFKGRVPSKQMPQGKMRGMQESYIKKLRHLLESEVDEAEIIIAAKGFSKSLQEMIEKIGRLQNEDLPPLSDQMRDTHGTPMATAFQDTTQLALQEVMDALYGAKDVVDQSVQKMASGQTMEPPTDMDAEVDLGMDDDLGMGDDLGMDDEFASAELDEPLGRAKKESVQNMKKRIAEMQNIIKRAKRIKESKNLKSKK